MAYAPSSYFNDILSNAIATYMSDPFKHHALTAVSRDAVVHETIRYLKWHYKIKFIPHDYNQVGVLINQVAHTVRSSWDGEDYGWSSGVALLKHKFELQFGVKLP